MTLTRKPCPGCGVKKSFAYEAGKVCPDCQQLLKEARRMRERATRMADLELVRVPFAAYALPSLDNIWDKPRDEIQESIFAMVELIGTKGHHHSSGAISLVSYEGRQSSMSSSPRTWLLPKGFAALVERLYAGVIDGGTYAYERGKEEGRNLIVGLATGRVSIDTFNDATIGETAQPKRRKRSRR